MHKWQVLIIVVGVGLLGQSAMADFISTANKGTKAYKQKDYKTALEMYRTAEADNPTSSELDYNIGTTLFQEGGYEEALDKFQKALRTTDIAVEASAHYNMGNAYYKSGDYEKAIQAYEEALKLNPSDMDAKFNLELARKMLKENIKPQQQNNQQNQQNQKDQQKQGQDQQKQDEQSQNQQNQENQQQDQQKQDQQQQQKMGDQKKMSKEDAERILNALKDDEQDIQKKIRRETVKGEYGGKDW